MGTGKTDGVSPSWGFLLWVPNLVRKTNIKGLISVVLNPWAICPPGDIRQCLEIFGVVTTG